MVNNIEKIIEEKVKELLPSILNQYKIYTKENLLTREEFLESLEMMNKRFEAMDQRFETLTKDMNQRFETLTKDMNQRFETMNLKL